MDPAVFGYIRVSQAEGEGGLATQRRILTGHGLRDDRIYTDVASGRTMRRPEWTTLRPGVVVVVPRIDRLARSLGEGLRAIEELHSEGIYIRAVRENLNQSQGGMYIRGAMKIGLVASVKPSHPYLENDPAPLFDLHYLRISPWLWFSITTTLRKKGTLRTSSWLPAHALDSFVAMPSAKRFPANA